MLTCLHRQAPQQRTNSTSNLGLPSSAQPASADQLIEPAETSSQETEKWSQEKNDDDEEEESSEESDEEDETIPQRMAKLERDIADNLKGKMFTDPDSRRHRPLFASDVRVEIVLKVIEGPRSRWVGSISQTGGRQPHDTILNNCSIDGVPFIINWISENFLRERPPPSEERNVVSDE